MKKPQQDRWRKEAFVKYIGSFPEYSKPLVDVVREFVGEDENILEVGCNCGQHLWALQKAGYNNLFGVDINKAAIESNTFPELKAEFSLVDVETEKLPFEDDSFGLVYSHGALMHMMNPLVLDEIARVSKKYICTVEHENIVNDSFVKRNYGVEFGQRGFVQIKKARHNQRKDLIIRVMEKGNEQAG